MTTPKRPFHTAEDAEIKRGEVSDVYFSRTVEILKSRKDRKRVKAEIYLKSLPDDWQWGILAGIQEVAALLEGVPVDVRAMEEGAVFAPYQPVLVVVGSYLGEALCQCHNARWEGSVMDVDNVRVVGWQKHWTPFRLLRDHLRGQARLEFEMPQESRSAHPGSDPWSRSVSNPAVPPCPWEPETWPQVGSLTHLARALSYSVISRYCEQRAGGT